MQLAGVVSLVEENESETIAKLWGVLKKELEGNNTFSPENYYGVIWYPSGGERPNFFYMAAIEMATAVIGMPDTVSSNLITKTIPASTCARFIHKGPWAIRQLTLDYIYQTWLPKSGRQLGHRLEIEYYGQRFYQPLIWIQQL